MTNTNELQPKFTGVIPRSIQKLLGDADSLGRFVNDAQRTPNSQSPPLEREEYQDDLWDRAVQEFGGYGLSRTTPGASEIADLVERIEYDKPIRTDNERAELKKELRRKFGSKIWNELTQTNNDGTHSAPNPPGFGQPRPIRHECAFFQKLFINQETRNNFANLVNASYSDRTSFVTTLANYLVVTHGFDETRARDKHANLIADIREATTDTARKAAELKYYEEGMEALYEALW